jgi:hypothetical protein
MLFGLPNPKYTLYRTIEVSAGQKNHWDLLLWLNIFRRIMPALIASLAAFSYSCSISDGRGGVSFNSHISGLLTLI